MRDNFADRNLMVFLFLVWITPDSTAVEPIGRLFARGRVLADAGTASQLPTQSEDAGEKESDGAENKKTHRDAEFHQKSVMTSKADADLERVVLQLVRTHLPQVNQVLDRLRVSNPADYQRAIRDLAKSARKLELAKKRDEALFEIEVEILKARSNINLLTAKLKVRDGESDRKSLRKATGELQKSELARDEYDMKVLEERVAVTQRQLDALKERIAAKRDDSDSQIEKDYLGYLRKAGHQTSDDPSENGTPQRKKKP